MADQPRRPRTLNDARTEAEAAFKRTTTKTVEAPPKPARLGVRSASPTCMSSCQLVGYLSPFSASKSLRS